MHRRNGTAWVNTSLGQGGRVLGLVLLLVGCATTQHVGERGLSEKQGTASYYANKFVGRSTASGEIYDPELHTAAHQSLPFGTRVRVTRVDHSETPSVVVRVNDRGPFKHGRIIDLSVAAARQLQMMQEGVVEVQLEIVSYPAGTETAGSDSSGTGSSDAGW